MKRLALASLLSLLGCSDEAPVIPPAVSDTDPTRSEGSGPTGYPTGFPLVPNGRAVEGAVDPGVVRTSVVEYTGTCEALETALRSAFTASNARLIDRSTLPEGTVSIRVELGGREASFSLLGQPGNCLLRTIASDRP